MIGVSEGSIQVQLPNQFYHDIPEWVARNTDLVNKVAEEHQNRLKIDGDLKVYPAALEFVASRNVTMDYSVPKDKRIIHVDGVPYPQGMML